MYVSVWVYTYIYIYIYIYIQMRRCKNLYSYVYICIYGHIHVHNGAQLTNQHKSEHLYASVYVHKFVNMWNYAYYLNQIKDLYIIHIC